MISKKVVLLSIAVAFFIIGVHQSFHYGIQASYWAFMLAGLCFLWIQYLHKQEEEKKKTTQKENTKRKKVRSKRK